MADRDRPSRRDRRGRQCCGAKKVNGEYVRCDQTNLRHRLPDCVLENGPMDEGTVCNTCYRFAMRCSQQEKQNHAKCCDGPTPLHRKRLEAFHLPEGIQFNFLDGPPARAADDSAAGAGAGAGAGSDSDATDVDMVASSVDWNQLLSRLAYAQRMPQPPQPVRRTQSDVGAAGGAECPARPTPLTTRSMSDNGRTLPPARLTVPAGHGFGGHGFGVRTSRTPGPRPRGYPFGTGAGESPRDPKRPRTNSPSPTAGKQAQSIVPTSSWASSIAFAASSESGDGTPATSSGLWSAASGGMFSRVAAAAPATAVSSSSGTHHHPSLDTGAALAAGSSDEDDDEEEDDEFTPDLLMMLGVSLDDTPHRSTAVEAHTARQALAASSAPSDGHGAPATGSHDSDHSVLHAHATPPKPPARGLVGVTAAAGHCVPPAAHTLVPRSVPFRPFVAGVVAKELGHLAQSVMGYPAAQPSRLFASSGALHLQTQAGSFGISSPPSDDGASGHGHGTAPTSVGAPLALADMGSTILDDDVEMGGAFDWKLDLGAFSGSC